MASNSKVLMELEGNARSSSASYLGSKLFFTGKESDNLNSDSLDEKPSVFLVPKSQVLGKVKDFLGMISESNKTLLQDAYGNPDSYDIEVLSGKESHIIEMDLMLGIADLHTREAVAAAEAAMAGYQPAISVTQVAVQNQKMKKMTMGMMRVLMKMVIVLQDLMGKIFRENHQKAGDQENDPRLWSCVKIAGGWLNPHEQILYDLY